MTTTGKTWNKDCAFHQSDDGLMIQGWLNAGVSTITYGTFHINSPLIFRAPTQFLHCDIYISSQFDGMSWYSCVGTPSHINRFLDCNLIFGSSLYRYDKDGFPKYIKEL